MTIFTGTAPTFVGADNATVVANLNILRDGLKATSEAWTAWTPTITADAGTFTTTSASGRYMRVNKLIQYQVSITITTVGTATGGLRFTLPVSAHSSGLYIGSGREMAVTGVMLFVLGNQGGGAGIGAITRYDNTSILGSGRLIAAAGTYEAA